MTLAPLINDRSKKKLKLSFELHLVASSKTFGLLDYPAFLCCLLFAPPSIKTQNPAPPPTAFFFKCKCLNQNSSMKAMASFLTFSLSIFMLFFLPRIRKIMIQAWCAVIMCNLALKKHKLNNNNFWRKYYATQLFKGLPNCSLLLPCCS